MTPEERQRFDAYLAAQRAMPWHRRLREALDQWASWRDVALRLMVVSVAIVIAWTLCR